MTRYVFLTIGGGPQQRSRQTIRHRGRENKKRSKKRSTERADVWKNRRKTRTPRCVCTPILSTHLPATPVSATFYFRCHRKARSKGDTGIRRRTTNVGDMGELAFLFRALPIYVQTVASCTTRLAVLNGIISKLFHCCFISNIHLHSKQFIIRRRVKKWQSYLT